MALKYKNIEEQAAAEAEFKGPWGEIAREETRCIHFVFDNYRAEEVWTLSLRGAAALGYGENMNLKKSRF